MSAPLPPQWYWLFRSFRSYAVRYARKHFHVIRLSKASGRLPRDGKPILVVMNHPSWWDPIVAFVLSQSFADAVHYGAMDSRAVAKYGFFKRAGLFAVEMHTFRGAAEFLRNGQAILSRDNTVLWITAQGEFADVRQRPLNLRSGVGHLAARMESGWVLPVALEYAFWNESKPEGLARFGDAIDVTSQPNLGGKAWTALIEAELTRTLDALSVQVMSRDAALFTALTQGRVGVGGVYDLWRRSKAWATGRKFDPAHGGTQ